MIMTYATTRQIARWVHLLMAIPVFGYLYSPFELLPSYAHPTRFVFFPIMVVTGLWMWKGHLLWRLLASPSP